MRHGAPLFYLAFSAHLYASETPLAQYMYDLKCEMPRFPHIRGTKHRHGIKPVPGSFHKCVLKDGAWTVSNSILQIEAPITSRPS